MDTTLKVVGGVLVGAVALLGLVMVLAPLGALFGGISATVVGWFFGAQILGTLQSMGLPTTITMGDIGVTLGFLGGFIRAVQTNTSTKV